MRLTGRVIFKIGGYDWELKLVDPKVIDGSDGICKPNDLQIWVRKDIKKEVGVIIFTHEVIHAILTTQGRFYQKDFNVEEVCELVAWQYPMIDKIVNAFDELVCD